MLSPAPDTANRMNTASLRGREEQGLRARTLRFPLVRRQREVTRGSEKEAPCQVVEKP